MNIKTLLKATILALLSCQSQSTKAQTYETNNVSVQTFVGSGFYGLLDGEGLFTMFNNPGAIVVDSFTNFFVLDVANSRIRKVTPSGTVSTFIGGGSSSIPGYGTNVSLNSYGYSGMTIDHANTIWLANGYSYSGADLLKITPDGLVLPINIAQVSSVNGLCVDSQNRLYLASSSDNRIYRYFTNGTVEVFVGSGNPGAIDGNWVFTSFRSPTHLAADAADNIYIWDSNNYLIRRVNQNRDVMTIAGNINSSSALDGVGTNAGLSYIYGMTFDGSGNLIFTSGYQGNSIRKMSPTTNVTTIAGNFNTLGFRNGVGSNALFQTAQGLCYSQGAIYVADSANHRIRKISMNTTEQIVSPSNLEMGIYPGVKITGTIGRAYRIESSTNMINWSREADLLLASNPQLWIDPLSVTGKKFYRAVLRP
jgi:opacity protein-like surface antigen